MPARIQAHAISDGGMGGRAIRKPALAAKSAKKANTTPTAR
jgi:hypothetical protein